MAQQISHLQRHMIEDMRLRNMSLLTQRAYIRSVKNFSIFFRRSPDMLTLKMCGPTDCI
jgi:hypothetical protein